MPVRFRLIVAPPGGWAVGSAGREIDIDVADPAPEILLGRRADVQLPLPFATLSSVHARVGHDGHSYWLEDAGSTNGTRLGGVRLAPGERRPLPLGAELHLADVRLRFEGAVPPQEPAAPPEGTATIARRLVANLLSDPVVPALVVSRGAPPRRLALSEEGRLYVAGRAESCALPLDVEHVSREHAAFNRSAGGVVVRDLGSKNGVLVNATRITADHLLTDGDTIQIGPVLLTLEDPIARYLQELAAGPDSVAASPALPGAPAPAPAARPRASLFARLSTTISIAVLALTLALVLTLLR